MYELRKEIFAKWKILQSFFGNLVKKFVCAIERFDSV